MVSKEENTILTTNQFKAGLLQEIPFKSTFKVRNVQYNLLWIDQTPETCLSAIIRCCAENNISTYLKELFSVKANLAYLVKSLRLKKWKILNWLWLKRYSALYEGGYQQAYYNIYIGKVIFLSNAIFFNTLNTLFSLARRISNHNNRSWLIQRILLRDTILRCLFSWSDLFVIVSDRGFLLEKSIYRKERRPLYYNLGRLSDFISAKKVAL